MSYKKLLLVISKILGLFVKTLIADKKYSLDGTENFPQRIQMILSQKPKYFPGFFIPFLKCTSNCKYFVKNDESPRLSISQIIDSKRDGYLNVQKIFFQATLRLSTC